MKEQSLLSMKDFAKLTEISQSTLRHYDDVKLFQPVYRSESGYRYYSLPQAVVVKFINILNRLNVPLKKISSIVDNRNPESILELLQKQQIDLNLELQHLQDAFTIIHAYCEIIQKGLMADEQVIKTVHIGEEQIELGSENDFSSGQFYESYFHFLKQMADKKVNSSAYPIGGYYDNADAFINKTGQPNRYFSRVPSGHSKKQEGKYLVGYTRGYYGSLGDLPERMKAYAEKHDLAFIGPVYEDYLHDVLCVADANQYLIQVSMGVTDTVAVV